MYSEQFSAIFSGSDSKTDRKLLRKNLRNCFYQEAPNEEIYRARNQIFSSDNSPKTDSSYLSGLRFIGAFTGEYKTVSKRVVFGTNYILF